MRESGLGRGLMQRKREEGMKKGEGAKTMGFGRDHYQHWSQKENQLEETS